MTPFDNEARQPLKVFRDWLQKAEQSELNDPTAAALATASRSGVPNVRMVLLKGVNDRGLRFFTNQQSQKGCELEGNPVAAICVHWKSLRRQVRFQGPVEKLSREETADYFHSRSRGSQIAAAVSAQSRPLTSHATLHQSVQQLTAELEGREVSLPEYWGGYLLQPASIEFWADGPDRLHDRIRFTRKGGKWSSERLYP